MNLKLLADLYLSNHGCAHCVTTQEYGEFAIEFPQSKLRKQFLAELNACMHPPYVHPLFEVLSCCREGDFDFYSGEGRYGMIWKFYGVDRHASDAYERFMWLTNY